MIITEIINLLEESPRMGNDIDDPEGTRYIQISDTLAKRLAKELKSHRYRQAKVKFSDGLDNLANMGCY